MTVLPRDPGQAACVVAFQRRHHLAADGVIGPETLRALRDEKPERLRARSAEQVREQHSFVAWIAANQTERSTR